ncbi:hypothetical protein [Halomonas tibetensis]|uniref:Transposase n=1 Tax=Halomonas tibetensis TaxID=2259590 RepID=A0ABV7B9D7_9GAMM
MPSTAKRLRDGASRKDTKVALIRLLFDRGYSREQILRLFTLIDWMIQLPKGLEREFLQAVYAIEEEKHMPYINTAERLGLEKGRQEGLQEGRQEGQLEANQETARNLIRLGVLSDEQIAEATGLAVADVQALRVEDKH